MAAVTDKQYHHGQGVANLRSIYGKTQKELAEALGITQQAVSNLEKSKLIDHVMVKKIARVFEVPEILISQYPETKLQNNIIEGNSFGDNAVILSHHFDKQNTYHPLDKLAEIFQEKEKLYERLIILEQQKADALQAELVKYNNQLLVLSQAIEELKKNNK